MSQPSNRAALGITLGVVLAIVLTISVVDFVRDDGSDTTRPQSAIDEATQARTPIEVASLGPQIGEQVPDFSLPDQNGQIQTLESILGPRGAMLLFHRSADW